MCTFQKDKKITTEFPNNFLHQPAEKRLRIYIENIKI